MHGDDVRCAGQQRCQMAAQVGVPGVGMHQAGGCGGGRHRQVGGDCLQCLVRARQAVPWLMGDSPGPVGALAVHGQGDQAAELAGQVLDVNSGSAVHIRRVFPRQQRHREFSPRTGGGHSGTSWPLPTTVMPPAETTNPRFLSCSLSTPIWTPSGTMTFLSRIASLTTACRLILVLFRMTARSTVAQLSTRTPVQSTDLRTSPPETMTPSLTRLEMARPTRSPLSCTNLAGGRDATLVRIGQRSLYRLKTGCTAHRSMCASKYESRVPTSRQ